ncbi:DUF2975 domain-containing protein [Microbacterium sp. zg.Y1090]|uniref:DUF2975 domain-containing protein n=1 Tax=Microbacterium TaxID=33882 RepID=UPI00214AD107|nr:MULTISPECIES: DUF2975 domain-containing protein [unclassified Microbacterium]MCR2811797.1 DUF2975 domain-containing protein [Microbacterium sp. zg.Y1084]MCR2818765.1 DUF2975 domain-containing protein [Microbacterium sp. zg.Y1090]MDL5486855.1 DUF2975 domain-containing protein [Microbacterium sp. zg-Y1211]WIM27082.1 DUF2975 domain-containing protein [Microbacterium sp. zg-Y1090]
MGAFVIGALRVVLMLALAGSLFVQVVMVPLLWRDLAGAPEAARIAAVVIVVLGIATLQICAVCIWRLLTMVRRGSVFSRRAFRYVDAMIVAILVGALLIFSLAVLLAPGSVAPGVVGLICGAALVAAGMALVVFVLRMLLIQAVERETEARRLRSELSEVI